MIGLLLTFLKLGFTSFGGPIAHLGYFRTEFVERKKWMSDAAYAELVALCQFLPGPASSQVGFGVGLHRGGLLGGLMAWLGFTAPSAVALFAFAAAVTTADPASFSGLLHGLKLVAVVVVIQAVWGMAKSFCSTALGIVTMILSAIFVLLADTVFLQLLVILFGAAMGLAFFKKQTDEKAAPFLIEVSAPTAFASGLLFLLGLVGLPIYLQTGGESDLLSLVDHFYRAGALVFGGGHVVLPLMEAELVESGIVTADHFFAGYGAAQAVPGPLFTIASFLGTASTSSVTGAYGALVATVAVFLPSFLLMLAVLPVWAKLRENAKAQKALLGVNAAVVGLLLAILYDPLWTTTVVSLVDLGMVFAGLLALMRFKIPVLALVVSFGLVGHFL